MALASGHMIVAATVFAALCAPAAHGFPMLHAPTAVPARKVVLKQELSGVRFRTCMALRMGPAAGGGEDDIDARIEKALSSRLVPGSAGKENMPMSRSAQRAYRRLGDELTEAVRANDAALVRQLCDEKGADPAFADEFGFTCLHLAAKRGYRDVVEALVALGADVNQQGEGATVPLHMAAQFGHLSLVQFMIELGGDVDLVDASGATPLRYDMHDNKSPASFEKEPIALKIRPTGRCTAQMSEPKGAV